MNLNTDLLYEERRNHRYDLEEERVLRATVSQQNGKRQQSYTVAVVDELHLFLELVL